MKGETLVLWSDLCMPFPSLSLMLSLSRSFSQERYITVAPYSFGNIARLTTGCNNFPYLAADVYAAATSKRARVALHKCSSLLDRDLDFDFDSWLRSRPSSGGCHRRTTYARFRKPSEWADKPHLSPRYLRYCIARPSHCETATLVACLVGRNVRELQLQSRRI